MTFLKIVLGGLFFYCIRQWRSDNYGEGSRVGHLGYCLELNSKVLYILNKWAKPSTKNGKFYGDIFNKVKIIKPKLVAYSSLSLLIARFGQDGEVGLYKSLNIKQNIRMFVQIVPLNWKQRLCLGAVNSYLSKRLKRLNVAWQQTQLHKVQEVGRFSEKCDHSDWEIIQRRREWMESEMSQSLYLLEIVI